MVVSNVKMQGVFLILMHSKGDFTYPPEVFPVGLLGDIVFGIDVSLKGAKASPLRNVFFAEDACNLEQKSY